MMFLDRRPVRSAVDVEYMRQIYNDNLPALSTHPIPEQSYETQQAWWETAKATNKAFLYYTEDAPYTPIAFMKLCNRGSFVTPIFAIIRSEWGKGYGKQIIKDYIECAGMPLAGEQLQSNQSICHLNKRAGWEIIGYRETSNGLIDLLYHPGIHHDYTSFEAVDDYLHEARFLHDFAVHGDDRGSLVSIEVGKSIPFIPKRLYYIYGTDQGINRGYHAHKNLQQLLICLHGKFTLTLDFGHSYVRKHFLENPSQGVYVPAGTWRVLEELSPDCVILSIVDSVYDPADYVRDYVEFLRMRGSA